MIVNFIIKSHLADDVSPLVGGSSKAPYRLVKHLSRRLKISRVIYFDGNHTGNEVYQAKRYAPPLLKLYLKTMMQNVLSLNGVYRAFCEADIVQCHHPHYGLGAALLRKFLFRDRKFIVKAHGTAVPELQANGYSGLKGRILAINAALHLRHDRFVLKQADVVLCSSNFQKQELIDVYSISADRLLSIYNGFDPDHMPLRPRLVASLGNHFVFCGRVVPKKGIPYAISLFKALAKNREHDTLKLLLGRRAEIENMETHECVLRMTKDDPRITVKYDLSEKELLLAFQNATLGLVTSVGYESIPTVIIEMLAVGLPVFSTYEWGVPELLTSQRGLTGVLDEDCALINDFFRNRTAQMPEEFPVGGRITDLSYDRISETYIEFYKSLTGVAEQT